MFAPRVRTASCAWLLAGLLCAAAAAAPGGGAGTSASTAPAASAEPAAAAGATASATTATAPEATAPGSQLQSIVVESSALGGGAVEVAKIPGNVQLLSAQDLTREGSADLTGAMNSTLGSIHINDNLDDPYQPDIVYRGFEASPVLGTPQGLAVYQNGVRINEAFGDTVNWDLFPEAAIERVEIVSSSPVYGLNALGGGISITMKNAFSAHDRELELSGGSYDQRAASLEYSVRSGEVGFYVAGKALDWDGWRRASSDAIRQLYAAFSVRHAALALDLSYVRADNRLNGQGAAPVQELAVNRSLIFTGPQVNVDTLDFTTLNARFELAPQLALESVIYDRQYAQTVQNGNTSEYTSCAVLQGLLCEPDALTPVTNAAGTPLPDVSRGGTVPIGENDYELIHSYSRGLTLQLTDGRTLFGHGNQLTAGLDLDEAVTDFFSGAQVGPLNVDLQVEPTPYIVDTPETSAAGQAYGGVPVSLEAIDKTAGFYAIDTLDLTAALALTVSARDNVSEIRLTDQRGSELTGRSRYAHLNPAAGLTYRITPAISAYASLAENTRTPTPSEIECSDPARPCLLPTNLSGDPPTLKQVVARTVELGLRGSPAGGGGAGSADDAGGAGALSWNLSVFRALLHDDIFGIATFVSQGYFQNIGDTRRQGIEAGIKYDTARWSAFANLSYVAAQFESTLTVPSPFNPDRDARGDVEVHPGNDLPGIPRTRFKSGLDFKVRNDLAVGATLDVVGSFHYVGDPANQLAPIGGYHTVGLHASYRPRAALELFASIKNLLDAKYATFGILSDPTGVGAAGIPRGAASNGPGVDNRFLSPAAPFEIFGGARLRF